MRIKIYTLIERNFDVTNNKVSTKNFVNYRTDDGQTVFTPEAGSEEFFISLMASQIPSLSTSGWSADEDSYQTNEKNGDGPASNLIDGDTNTIWHSRYNNSGLKVDMVYPNNVIITFDGTETFEAFAYVGRANGTNGHIKNYKLYANTGNSTLDFNSTDSQWFLISQGAFNYSDGTMCKVNLAQAVTAKQVKLVTVDEVEGRSFASGVELSFYADKFE